MFKKFYATALVLWAAILLVGCTSEDQEPQSNEVQVKFNVGTSLEVTTEPISNQAKAARVMSRAAADGDGEDASLGDLVKEIGYRIYKSDGKLYKSGSVSYDPATQTAPEDFGTLKEKLLPATYYIVFYAYGKTGSTPTIYSDNTTEKFYFTDYGSQTGTELFIYKGNLTVTSSTTEVSVKLTRQSALLSLQISDDPIDEAAYVKCTVKSYIRFYPKPGMSYYNTDESGNYTHTTTITDGKLPDTNMYFLNPLTPTTLTIYIYDSSDQLLGSQEVSVPLYSNRRTIVSGNLFSNLGDKPLTVSIDDSWGEDVSVSLN